MAGNLGWDGETGRARAGHLAFHSHARWLIHHRFRVLGAASELLPGGGESSGGQGEASTVPSRGDDR
eukprot:11954493-Prorocentrum_lima.AAC.1